MGKRMRSCALAVLCLLTVRAGVHAQARYEVTYISPIPGSRFILPGSNIIIRVRGGITTDAADRFIRSVQGESTGPHPFSISVSDDGCTVLCTPSRPFAPGEGVLVEVDTSTISWGECIRTGDEFRFTITPRQEPYVNLASALRATEFPPGIPRAASRPMAAGVPADTGVITPRVKVLVSAATSPGYLFLSNLQSAPTDIPALLILRNDGTPVFARDMFGDAHDFKLQPNGQLTYEDDVPGAFYVMDSTLTVVDSIRCGNGYPTDDHELRLLPNGHWLLLGIDPEPVDMSAVVPGGLPTATVFGCIIQELDSQKNVVFQWRSWDHFKITDAQNVDMTAPTVDYVHGNALDVESDGNILLSSRHLSEITKIDRSTGGIIWRMGGANNQFTFVNDSIGFNYQHAVRWLPNGHIIFFDNGDFHNPPFSRAVEYSVDENRKVATLVWQYRHVPDILGFAMGYVQRLENGNTLIGWGAATPTVTELARNGAKVYEMSFDSTVYSYRAYRFDWHPAPAPAAADQAESRYSLEQNYPNPFNPSTIIRFTTPAESHVTLDVFNITGQHVATLIDDEMPGGVHTARFTPTTLASGVYFYRLRAGSYVATKSFLYLK